MMFDKHRTLNEIINSLKIPDTQKNIIKISWLHELDKSSRQYKLNNRLNKFAQNYTTIAGSIAAFLVAFSNPFEDLKGGYEKYANIGAIYASFSTALVSGIQGINNFAQNSRDNKRTNFLLTREGFMFIMLSGTYTNFKNHSDAVQLFVNETQTILKERLDRELSAEEMIQTMVERSTTDAQIAGVQAMGNMKEINRREAEQKREKEQAEMLRRSQEKQERLEKEEAVLRSQQAPPAPPAPIPTPTTVLRSQPTPPAPPAPTPKYITPEKLKSIIPNATLAKCQKYAEPLNKACIEGDINTPLRIAGFISQVAHETGSLQYEKELGDAKYFTKNYEGRKDLGNTNPGDGARYAGRGFFQLTGRYNYEKCGKAIGVDLINNPDSVASDPYINAKATVWYWQQKNLNKIADEDNIEKLTRAINGGLNGLNDRKQFYQRAKQILNT